MRRVVVTGLGLVSPVGNDVKTSWDGVLNCAQGIDTITSYDASTSEVKIAAEVKNFNPESFIPIKDIKKYCRFTQFAMYAGIAAIDDAGLSKDSLGDRAGCAIGVGIGGLETTYETSLLLKERGQRRVSPFFVPLIIPNMAAGNTATLLNLKGPNICPTTACASGTHGIGEAFLYIKNNMADIMLCGGSEATICDLSISGFNSMRALSRNNENPREASKPFSADRDGFVLGEGAGLLVLEELEHAKKRGAKIYAEICGYGLSCDAYHMTAPAPEGEGAQRAMKAALFSAGLNTEDVDYINAHGTSTPYNDLNESLAIEHVFSDHAKKLAVSSIKGVVGHSLGAAGGIEGVVLALSLKEQIAPPTANLVNQDPACRLDYVPLVARNMKIRAALSNSFGFGGTNASIAMKEFS